MIFDWCVYWGGGGGGGGEKRYVAAGWKQTAKINAVCRIQKLDGDGATRVQMKRPGCRSITRNVSRDDTYM